MTQSFYKSGNFCIGHFRTLFQCHQSCLPFSEAVLKSIFNTQMVPFFEVEKLQVRLNIKVLKGRFLILNLVIVQSPMRVWNWIYLGRRGGFGAAKKWRWIQNSYSWLPMEFFPLAQNSIDLDWKMENSTRPKERPIEHLVLLLSPTTLAFHIYGSHFNPCQKRST